MMDMGEEEHTHKLEMPKVGILRGVKPRDIEVVGEKIVNIRVKPRPYSNTYTVDQLRAIRKVADKYGSGKIHISPRHNLELPEIRETKIMNVLRDLYVAGLSAGGSGTAVRNIFTCADWCAQKVRPVQGLGRMVAQEIGDTEMPNKVTISFAACPSACSRPHNTDIGIIGVARLKVVRPCKGEECENIQKACPIPGAIEVKDGKININDSCVQCARCAWASGGAIEVEATGFRVLIGGKEGRFVSFGEEYSSFAKDYDVLDIIDRAIGNYKARAEPRDKKKMERLGEVKDRMGLEEFMK